MTTISWSRKSYGTTRVFLMNSFIRLEVLKSAKVLLSFCNSYTKASHTEVYSIRIASHEFLWQTHTLFLGKRKTIPINRLTEGFPRTIGSAYGTNTLRTTQSWRLGTYSTLVTAVRWRTQFHHRSWDWETSSKHKRELTILSMSSAPPAQVNHRS